MAVHQLQSVETNIANPRSVIVDQLSSACEDLFDHYKLKIKLAESTDGPIDESDDIDIIGLLGSSAGGLRTSVAIQTNLNILQATYPASLEGEKEQKLRDWIGELSNQLLGRLKNKLIPYGCELTLGVPAVIQGTNLKAVLPKRTEITTHRYSTETGDNLYLILSTLIEDGHFTLHAPESQEAEELMAEGDFIFF